MIDEQIKYFQIQIFKFEKINFIGFVQTLIDKNNIDLDF